MNQPGPASAALTDGKPVDLDSFGRSVEQTLQELGRLAKRLTFPLTAFHPLTGAIHGSSSDETLPRLPMAVFRRLQHCFEPEIITLPGNLLAFLLPLQCSEERLVGVGYVRSASNVELAVLSLISEETAWSAAKTEAWCTGLPVCSAEVLAPLLRLAFDAESEDKNLRAMERDLESITDEMHRNYEELNLLHGLTRNLTLSRPPKDLARACLKRLQDCLHCGGNAILMSEGSGDDFLVEGEMPLTAFGFTGLLDRFSAHDWSQPLVRNFVRQSSLAADLPGVENFVIVPIGAGKHRQGWIVSVNSTRCNEFGTVEASLMNSVATILGTHLRNIELYREHDELLLSFVRSFISTLDAKDPYTRGHSERVALIARRLAKELGFTASEMHTVYVSGLLHDVGKIGVDDRILRKPGRLTDDEFEQIKQHPVIGYEILKGMRNLQYVIPGVRSHHEAWDGRGYPDGLKGEEIPLMARILAVADSYDAMSSDRPYRKGMPLEKVSAIFEKEAGQQWDADIIAAFFNVREDILRLCEEYDRGLLHQRQRDVLLEPPPEDENEG